MSGVATSLSKSSMPPAISSTSDSPPTCSAPASRAAASCSAPQTTATRTVLPVPLGSATVARAVRRHDVRAQVDSRLAQVLARALHPLRAELFPHLLGREPRHRRRRRRHGRCPRLHSASPPARPLRARGAKEGPVPWGGWGL